MGEWALALQAPWHLASAAQGRLAHKDERNIDEEVANLPRLPAFITHLLAHRTLKADLERHCDSAEADKERDE